ncbi:uncharacterized protein EI90DRAFT_3011323 [Cantharellus anzutake]|uniref:uncharacterized protein n=1 Tax=Cantharellus anzutake TaxID=1750568 RepID=UPI00190705AA|nr:uncharacterized protein EI90DRAFT_3011323 [Cantharellus anzutake]KAF8342871.1 hypothetical protein EI90DRAFT_3011323 [Cantharellus anzutake]
MVSNPEAERNASKEISALAPDNFASSVQTNATTKGNPSPKSNTTGNSNSFDSILTQNPGRFDQLQLMTEFEDDAKLQEEFEAEFNKRMLDLMLEFRVWAECRPTHERDTHGEQLVKEMEEIEAREISQGNYIDPHSDLWYTMLALSEQTRQNLVNFLVSIRSALSALTRA